MSDVLYCNFVKKETLARVFFDNIANFLRTPFFTEHLRWLLLKANLSPKEYLGPCQTSMALDLTKNLVYRHPTLSKHSIVGLLVWKKSNLAFLLHLVCSKC